MKTIKIRELGIFTLGKDGLWSGRSNKHDLQLTSIKDCVDWFHYWENVKKCNEPDFYIYDIDNKICWCSNEKHIEHHIINIETNYGVTFDRSNFVIGLPTEADFAKYDNI